jgi:uncharacterized membrane protein
MIKERILLIVGSILVIVPFLGIPVFFREIVGGILGAVVIFIAYVFFVAKKVRMLRKQQVRTESAKSGSIE